MKKIPGPIQGALIGTGAFALCGLLWTGTLIGAAAWAGIFLVLSLLFGLAVGTWKVWCALCEGLGSDMIWLFFLILIPGFGWVILFVMFFNRLDRLDRHPVVIPAPQPQTVNNILIVVPPVPSDYDDQGYAQYVANRRAQLPS